MVSLGALKMGRFFLFASTSRIAPVGSFVVIRPTKDWAMGSSSRSPSRPLKTESAVSAADGALTALAAFDV